MLTLFLFSALWSHQLLWLEIEFYIFFHGKKILLAQFSRIFQCNKALYYLKKCFSPNTWDGQQYEYLKHDGDNVANKKMTLGQVVTNCTRTHAHTHTRARVCVCVCYKTIVVYTIHDRKLCTYMFILKENVWVFSNIFDRKKFSAERCAFLYGSALD